MMTAFSSCMIRVVAETCFSVVIKGMVAVAPCMCITVKLYNYLRFSINKGSSKKLIPKDCRLCVPAMRLWDFRHPCSHIQSMKDDNNIIMQVKKVSNAPIPLRRAEHAC